MYTAYLTISRIQQAIKEKGYTQKKVFADCGIGEDTVKRMSDNKGISSFYLAKIADYLNCSVDYLLGRTDVPELKSNDDIELFSKIQKLPLSERSKVIVLIDEMNKSLETI